MKTSIIFLSTVFLLLAFVKGSNPTKKPFRLEM